MRAIPAASAIAILAALAILPATATSTADSGSRPAAAHASSAPAVARTTTSAATPTSASTGSSAASSTTPSSTDAAPACQNSKLDESAALAGGAVTVSPVPNSLDASYRTQISFVGVPVGDISNVTVVGEKTKAHAGQLEAYSQGDGASFVPDVPFAQGEGVTVRADITHEGQQTPIAWRFTTAEVDETSRSLETPPGPPPPSNPAEYQHFVSRPELTPPTVTVTTDTGDTSPGDLMLAPYAGPGQYGPMILNGKGELIWFYPLAKGARAADLRVQELEGKPVLTWWQDPLVSHGDRSAGVEIANSEYKPIDIVRGGNGYQPDLHAFKITSRGTALFTVYDAIRCNLSTFGGPPNGSVADTVAQEIDLKTGLVRFEWHSLDHVSLRDSYVAASYKNGPSDPWDFFHINAIEPQPEGQILINSRNTWTAYQISEKTGQIIWRLGGKESTFKLGPHATPAWQHDAREQPGGIITFFDNGGTPKVHSQSRGLVLRINLQNKTATFIRSFVTPKPLLAASQGDLQPLSDGDWFAGWGQEPYFSEFSAAGQLLFDAHLPPAYQSFTVLKYPWSANPYKPPRLGVRTETSGLSTAYVSWNGATQVASWQLLGGSTPTTLEPLGPQAAKTSFETAIPIPGHPAYVAVQAFSENGELLGHTGYVKL